MSKKVMIDGVDVKKCEFYNECDKKVPYYSDIACLNDFSNICIFKQLKRLQAENEELKKEIWQLQHHEMWNKEATLQAELLIKENERLKESIAQLKEKYNTLIYKKESREEAFCKQNKELYEEKNCLHKIIDRLLENAGYSKDIASAEDFEEVYEDMQIKRNELEEYRKALEEIREILCEGRTFYEGYFEDEHLSRTDKAIKVINEVLDD